MAESSERTPQIMSAPIDEGVDWSMALIVSILEVLEEERPGFRDKVRDSVLARAERLEEEGAKSKALDVRDLAGSWIFNDTVGDPIWPDDDALEEGIVR